MQTINYVMPCARKNYKDLFSDSVRKFLMAEAIIDGFCGGMIIDDYHKPSVGRIWYGMENYFGGNVSHANAKIIMPKLPGLYHMLFSGNSQWPHFLFDAYNGQLKKSHCFQFKIPHPNLEHLSRLSNHPLPEGLRLARIDLDSARVMEQQETPDDDYCCIPSEFNSAEDFVSRSYGFCIRSESKVFSRISASYPSSSPTDVEIDIETRPEVQGKGFATIVAAAFIIDCVENGIAPIWNTTSTLSAKLAEKLGFDLTDAFETLLLATGVFDPSMNVDHSIPIALRRFEFGKKEEYPHLNES
ncbi:MAG: GNAT family N-acetyltransferase [Chloroflexota bacterium]